MQLLSAALQLVTFLDALLEAGGVRVDAEDGRGHGALEGCLDAGPYLVGLLEEARAFLEVREGGEGRCEVVVLGVGGVGLDVHEDGEAVDERRNGLRCRGCRAVERCNKAFDGPHVLSRCGVDAVEEVGEGARVLVGGRVGRVDGEPVCEGGHVVRCEGQDVDEALGAPVGEVGVGVADPPVQAQDGVGDVEVELRGGEGHLVGCERRAEVEGREGPIEMGELVRELDGELALHGGR